MSRSRVTKLYYDLVGKMDEAVREYELITGGDRILVAVSGGSDSMSLLTLLRERTPVYGAHIELYPVYLDPGFSDDPEPSLAAMREFFAAQVPDYHVEVTDTGDIAHSEVNRKNPCFLCARMRRQRLYELADAENCNKIAFGHHKDDIIETFLLNIFYGREISTMLPKQSVFGGKFFLIRPLAYIFESELKAFAREQRFNVIKNGCPTEPVSKRSYVKKLLEQLERDYRGTKENIFKSLKNVKPDYLL